VLIAGLFPNEARTGLDSLLSQSTTISLKTREPACGVEWTGEEANVPVPQTQKVVCRQPPSHLIVDADVIDDIALGAVDVPHVPVEDHDP